MSTQNITLDKNTSEELYDKASKMIDTKEDFEDLLDKRLIDEIFSREVVKFVSKMHPLDENEFKVITTLVGNKTIKVSYGKIKKTIDSAPKLTYGII